MMPAARRVRSRQLPADDPVVPLGGSRAFNFAAFQGHTVNLKGTNQISGGTRKTPGVHEGDECLSVRTADAWAGRCSWARLCSSELGHRVRLLSRLKSSPATRVHFLATFVAFRSVPGTPDVALDSRGRLPSRSSCLLLHTRCLLQALRPLTFKMAFWPGALRRLERKPRRDVCPFLLRRNRTSSPRPLQRRRRGQGDTPSNSSPQSLQPRPVATRRCLRLL